MHRNKNRKKKQWVRLERNRALWPLARVVYILGFQRLGIWIGRHAVKAEVIA